MRITVTRIVLVAVALALASISSASAADLPFTVCGSGNVATVKSIDVTGNIAAGSTIHLDVEGSVSEDVNDGSFEIVVSLLGIPLLTKKGDICNNPFLSAKCPVSKGPVTLTGAFPIPSIAPKGKYGLKATGKSSNGDNLFCVDLSLEIGAAGESSDHDVNMLALAPTRDLDEEDSDAATLAMQAIMAAELGDASSGRPRIVRHFIDGDHDNQCTEIKVYTRGIDWYEAHKSEFNAYTDGWCPHRKFNFWEASTRVTGGVMEARFQVGEKSSSSSADIAETMSTQQILETRLRDTPIIPVNPNPPVLRHKEVSGACTTLSVYDDGMEWYNNHLFDFEQFLPNSCDSVDAAAWTQSRSLSAGVVLHTYESQTQGRNLRG